MQIKICPRCNSSKIELKSPILGKCYICKNCNFSSYLFPEIEVKNLSELKKLKIRKKSEFAKAKKTRKR